MLSAKTNKDKIEELDRLMTQHKDICDHAREVIEKKGKVVATFIRDKLSFRDTKH